MQTKHTNSSLFCHVYKTDVCYLYYWLKILSNTFDIFEQYIIVS